MHVPATYLCLATDEQTLLMLRDALKIQREHGVQNPREVSVAEIAHSISRLRPERSAAERIAQQTDSFARSRSSLDTKSRPSGWVCVSSALCRRLRSRVQVLTAMARAALPAGSRSERIRLYDGLLQAA